MTDNWIHNIKKKVRSIAQNFRMFHTTVTQFSNTSSFHPFKSNSTSYSQVFSNVETWKIRTNSVQIRREENNAFPPTEFDIRNIQVLMTRIKSQCRPEFGTWHVDKTSEPQIELDHVELLIFSAATCRPNECFDMANICGRFGT